MLHLVSCVGQKRDRPSPAKDLYTSDWFHKARAYVESKESRWYILSAEYGLLDPERVVNPYEKTLNTMKIRGRRLWAERVFSQLQVSGIADVRLSFLAGQRYREFLVPQLRGQGIEVEIPMEGLRIGEQLRWLGEQVRR